MPLVTSRLIRPVAVSAETVTGHDTLLPGSLPCARSRDGSPTAATTAAGITAADTNESRDDDFRNAARVPMSAAVLSR